METNKAFNWVPPGHFYSPIPDPQEIARRHHQLWRSLEDLPGIDLRIEYQRKLLRLLRPFYENLPHLEEPSPELRFTFNNGTYSWSDAIFYGCMLQFIRPRRVIEVGCGNSSALALDINELFLDSQIDFTFIEPFASLPFELPTRTNLLRTPVQDVPMKVFEDLAEGDLLFIDSTHVSKTASDVNYLYLDVIPRLAAGVFIHIHDVFLNFEYPERWVLEGRAWNEQYLLRAMLCNNHSIELVLMTSVLHVIEKEYLSVEMPLCQKNPGGSIYLRTKNRWQP